MPYAAKLASSFIVVSGFLYPETTINCRQTKISLFLSALHYGIASSRLVPGLSSQDKSDLIYALQFFGAVKHYSSYACSHSCPSFKNMLKYRADFYFSIDLSSNNQPKVGYRPFQVCHHISFEGLQLCICSLGTNYYKSLSADPFLQILQRTSPFIKLS